MLSKNPKFFEIVRIRSNSLSEGRNSVLTLNTWSKRIFIVKTGFLILQIPQICNFRVKSQSLHFWQNRRRDPKWSILTNFNAWNEFLRLSFPHKSCFKAKQQSWKFSKNRLVDLQSFIGEIFPSQICVQEAWKPPGSEFDWFLSMLKNFFDFLTITP